MNADETRAALEAAELAYASAHGWFDIVSSLLSGWITVSLFSFPLAIFFQVHVVYLAQGSVTLVGLIAYNVTKNRRDRARSYRDDISRAFVSDVFSMTRKV